MNHKCYADLYPIGSRWFLRCFLDGIVLRAKKEPPLNCPHCHRPLDPIVYRKPRLRVTTTVQIKTALGWVDHSVRTKVRP